MSYFYAFLLFFTIVSVYFVNSSDTVDYYGCLWTFECCKRDETIGNCLELCDPVINCTSTETDTVTQEKEEESSNLIDSALSRFSFRPLSFQRDNAKCRPGFSPDFSGRCRKIWT